jgi:hypothetical protein
MIFRRSPGGDNSSLQSLVNSASVLVGLALAYELRFCEATLRLGRFLSDDTEGTGFQDAITPPELRRYLMFLLRTPSNLSFKISCTIIMVLAALAAPPASAQTGVIAFRDDCTELLYAMRGDGTGRIALPLPQRPQPTSEYEYWDPWVLDVSTSGPLTVVYYVGIVRFNPLTLVDFGLFAVQLNDVGGVLSAGPPVRLTLPADVGFAGVNPNFARVGSFSPIGFRDRLALVANSQTDSVLMTARVDRDDSTLKIIGLSDLVVVGDLYSLANLPTPEGFTGDIDYSPDGSSVVASISSDLWMVHLLGDNTFGGAALLTANTDGFAEWKPSFSPDGTLIAYTAGPLTTFGGVSGRNMDIYSLTLDTGAVTRVTTNRNKGRAASEIHNAMWRSDGAWIGFSAYTSFTPRRSQCSGLVNSEIFLIKADGSSTASQITNTSGTSVEVWPKWGW